MLPARLGKSIAVGIAVGGGTTWALAKARKKHPKLVMAALGIGAGVRVGVGIHNWQKLDECRR